MLAFVDVVIVKNLGPYVYGVVVKKCCIFALGDTPNCNDQSKILAPGLSLSSKVEILFSTLN